MVTPWKRPDVPVKVRKEFDNDRVGRLRNEIALRDFQFVFLEWAGFREQLVACAGRENQEIRALPFAINAVPWPWGGGFNGNDMGAANLAARFACTVQKQAVQNGARIDNDGMRHVERSVLLVAGDEFDRVNQLLRIGIIEQEREALDGFVSQAAPARLLPGEMFIKNFDGVACAGKFHAA